MFSMDSDITTQGNLEAPNIIQNIIRNNNDSNLTISDVNDLKAYSLYWAAFYINIYYIWIIFAVGFPGNLAIIITILRMKPSTSSTYFVTVLAVADNITIIYKLVYHQITLQDVHLGIDVCRAMYYFGSFLIMYVNWVLVAMTGERFVAIWFPIKVSVCCSQRNVITILVTVAGVLLLADMHLLWTVTERVHNDTGTTKVDCSFNDDAFESFSKLYYWIDGSLYAILPCIFLSVFNFLIILGIRRSARIHRDFSRHTTIQVERSYRQQRQITIMLFAVSIMFVLLTIPNCVFFIVKAYWAYPLNTYEHVQFLFTQQIIFLLSDINNAANFYLYFLSGKRFRRRFCEIVLCRKRWYRVPQLD